ncbi:ABC transporter permease [soil metagenome]
MNLTRRLARAVAPEFFLILAVLVVWIVGLEAFDVSPLIGARPWTVAFWLSEPANGAETLAYLMATARDTAVGFVIGLGLSLIAACTFVVVPAIEQAVGPLLVLLRVVPLVVLTPVLTLLFGGGLGGVSATVSIVVFFPALAMLVFGLRSSPAILLDVVAVNGGGRVAALLWVRLRAALPFLVGAATVTLPAAVTGATIAEWLVTGLGLGGAMSRAAGSFRFVEVWADAAVLTASTVLVHVVLSAIRAILDRSVEIQQ